MDTKALDKLPSKDGEIKKEEPHILIELIEYEHDAIVRKTILQNDSGSIDALAFEVGKGLNETVSAYDIYVQIIDGSAIIDISGKSTTLETGHGILVPAHHSSHIRPNGRFKLLLTIIESE